MTVPAETTTAGTDLNGDDWYRGDNTGTTRRLTNLQQLAVVLWRLADHALLRSRHVPVGLVGPKLIYSTREKVVEKGER